MPANPQVQNARSRELIETKRLWDAIFGLKQARASLDLLGVATLPEEEFAASAIGELSHLTAAKVRRLIAAMDVLDAALLGLADLGDGMTAPPAKALVDAIR